MEVVEGIATVDDVDAFVADLGAIGAERGCAVQAFDARYVLGRAHLERAVELADRARERGEAIADDPAVEILLYAAGRRQIDRALAMGVDAGEGPVVVVVHGPDGDEAGAAAAVCDRLAPAETLGDYDESLVREFFGIGERESAATDAALADLVGERVALLPVEK
ncbi:MAG: KEOPS complex subunit Cgi121 [Haloarculaceae archaeon]